MASQRRGCGKGCGYTILAGVALFIGLVILGAIVGSPKSNSAASRPPTSTPMATHPPANTHAPAGGGHVALTGFGATVGEWNSTHQQTSGMAPGAIYDPVPSLPQVDGHVGSRYAEVTPEDGRILTYSMAFAPDTTRGEAIFFIEREFPRDVHVLWTARKDTCLQLEVASATLGTVLSAPAIGDPKGEALVELSSDEATGGNPSYYASDVRDAILTVGSYATPDAAPGC